MGNLEVSAADRVDDLGENEFSIFDEEDKYKEKLDSEEEEEEEEEENDEVIVEKKKNIFKYAGEKFKRLFLSERKMIREMNKKDEEIRKLRRENNELEKKMNRIVYDLAKDKLKLNNQIKRIQREKIQSVCMNSKRGNIMKEFYFSEKKYVNNLKILEEKYILKFKKKKLMKQTMIEKIFGDFNSLLEINESFLTQLEKSVFEKKKDEALIECVLKFSKSFKEQYSAYIKKYIQSYDLLSEQIKKNKKLEKFCNHQAKKIRQKSFENTNESTIYSLSILPIQRIPRYRLLLKDLLSHTKKSKNVMIYEKLVNSIKTIENILTYCNQETKNHQDTLNIIKLSKLLNLTLIKGKVYFEHHNLFDISKQKYKRRVIGVYLFNELLVIHKRSVFSAKSKKYDIMKNNVKYSREGDHILNLEIVDYSPIKIDFTNELIIEKFIEKLNIVISISESFLL